MIKEKTKIENSFYDKYKYLGVGDFVSVTVDTRDIYTGILGSEITKHCNQISLKQVTIYNDSDTKVLPDDEIVTLDVDKIQIIN